MKDIDSPNDKNEFTQHIEVDSNKINSGFYNDKKTNHESILFLVSNIATSVFYLTVPIFVGVNFSKINEMYSFAVVLLALLFAALLFLVAIYVIVITGGRLAITLSGKNISERKAKAYIFTVTPIAFFTIFIYMVILTL